MKKNILFVMNNLQCGGAEKALISLLDTIDYAQFEVDLMLFKHEGIFLSKLPKQVNLLKEPYEYRYFDMPIKMAVKKSLKEGRLNIVLARVLAGLIFKSETNGARCEQKTWKYVSMAFEKLNKQYDAAIGFLEKNPVYFCVDKVNAKKKIGFMHTDYEKMRMDPKLDISYFEELDHIVTVSEENACILKKKFPMFSEKISVMQNIISPEIIRKMSLEKIEVKEQCIKIVSVGRLHSVKGFDMAVHACKNLVESGYDLKWYVIGEGEEKKKLEKLIEQKNLKEKFILLGLKENPYPYVKEADIYVQPSRFEGKSIAIDEAKILQKPILTTNFATVKDQLIHLETGFIVEITPESIADGIEKLITDHELRTHLSTNLSKEKLGTESEVKKLYAMFKAG